MTDSTDPTRKNPAIGSTLSYPLHRTSPPRQLPARSSGSLETG
ncbi:hypothetical protein HALLA_06895 [Halostagnicola larsenii XH-48]|uniref:Uncharacterized protein n=1 Tax=Halostagnicola larsenii XH-48 TaxID=797299 RepID=W0JU04_9EURY|nr:hypothetical protein HALLA_06895 [Halostagnicola larsenii XH-48]